MLNFSCVKLRIYVLIFKIYCFKFILAYQTKFYLKPQKKIKKISKNYSPYKYIYQGIGITHSPHGRIDRIIF
jgi:hypothetical protein